MISSALNPIQGAGCPHSGYDYLRNSYSKYVENQNLTKILFDIVFQILRRFSVFKTDIKIRADLRER